MPSTCLVQLVENRIVGTIHLFKNYFEGYDFIGIFGCSHDSGVYCVLLVWTEDQVLVKICRQS